MANKYELGIYGEWLQEKCYITCVMTKVIPFCVNDDPVHHLGSSCLKRIHFNMSRRTYGVTLVLPNFSILPSS